MASKSFDDRLDRIQWQPGAVPSREMVDRLIGGRRQAPPQIRPRGAEATLAGAVLGILIGVALKGMVLPGSPWGPGTGLTGAIAGALALAGLGASLPLALFAALRHRSRPRLLQFASMNLLMIVVLLLN